MLCAHLKSFFLVKEICKAVLTLSRSNCEPEQSVLLEKLHAQKWSPTTPLFTSKCTIFACLSLHETKHQSLSYVIIATLFFFFLTISFTAACTILGKRNGGFGFSVVSCTAIATFVALLVHSLPGCLAGRKGRERWLCSDMLVSAISLRCLSVCVCPLST